VIDRRTMVAGGAALAVAGGAGVARARRRPGLEPLIAAIEARAGGRLGVAVTDVDGRRLGGHRAGERFPICSTFKALAAAALLARVDAGRESLDRVVRYAQADLVPYSPETARHLDTGMTLAAICEAAMTLSDNTAGNLMLRALGGDRGPAALSAFLRATGDDMTRLDRTEPTLNTAIPGDPRDTGSPEAMAASFARLGFGHVLSGNSRARWLGWLGANRTGAKRLRAGIPPDWRIGDKTGSGEHGTVNDVAVLWPPNGRPILLACLFTGSGLDEERRGAVIAEVGRVVSGWWRGRA
jgi:beta-lactamase class A